jgi:hypothetical protein
MNNQRTVVLFGIVFVLMAGLLIWQGTQPSDTTMPVLHDNDNTTYTPTINANNADPSDTDTTGSSLPDELQPIFTDWGASQVQAIRFEDPFNNDVISVRRTEDNQWQAVEFTGDIQQDIADGLARTVAILPYSTTLEGVDPENYAQFGLTLDSVLMLITVLLDNGDQHVIAIGTRTPDSNNHYVLIDERPDIYVVPVQPVAFLLAYPVQMVTP